MTTVKITELTDIGANLATSTVVPVVNMAGTPTTQKTNIGNIANLILEGAGVDYPEASVALLAQTVSNAAQPNITSVGTLTTLAVSGNATVNGNITSNGTAYVGNLSTTGLASITTLSVGATANLGAVGNVKITGGTVGQVLSTDGAGNLSWTSDTTTYGNSNVVTLLGAFGSNTITTTGNVSVGNITATNLGNISTINLTGSSSNVLYGNGVFAPAAGGGSYGNSNVATFLAAYGSNTITTTGNVSVGNLLTNGAVKIGNATISEINPIVIGFSEDIYVDGDVLAQRLKSNTGTVSLNASNSTANTEWAFNVNGTLNLPQPLGNVSTSIQSIYSNSSSFVDFVSNNSANFTFGTTANNNIVLITGLNQNDNRWVFGYNGNLTLPGNTFAVNYANGAQVSLGGSSNTGNVTFNGNVISTSSTNDLLINLNGQDFIANTSNGGAIGLYSGNSQIAINNDTPGIEITSLNVNLVALANGDINLDATAANGVVDIESAGNTTITANGNVWTFDLEGNLILAGGESAIQSVANSSLDPLNPNVSTMIFTPSRGYSSQSLVLDPTAPGHIHLRAPSSNIDEPLANIFLGGEESSFEVGYYNGSAPNVFIHSGGNTWTFDTIGSLNLPTIELDVGNTINEQTIIQSQRKIIPPFRYSVDIDGSTPTVVYSATDNSITSMKVTMQIQHTGLGFEFFDVSATSSGADTYYTVSNRLHPPGITDSTVVVDLDGSNAMEITVTINSGAANSWVTYDATEFGIAVD